MYTARLLAGVVSYAAPIDPEARWQSGYAAACKAVDAGSIPTLASIFPSRPGGGIGRRWDLKSLPIGVPVRVRPWAPAPSSLGLTRFACHHNFALRGEIFLATYE